MAKYEVQALSFIGNRLCNPGDIVELDDDAQVADNLKLVGKKAKASAPGVSAEASRLITALRIHATSRGAESPDAVTETDFDEVLKGMDPKPSAEVIAEAAAATKVTLGSALA